LIIALNEKQGHKVALLRFDIMTPACCFRFFVITNTIALLLTKCREVHFLYLHYAELCTFSATYAWKTSVTSVKVDGRNFSTKASYLCHKLFENNAFLPDAWFAIDDSRTDLGNVCMIFRKLQTVKYVN